MILKNNNIKSYFITGRRAKDFKDETIQLLSQLGIKDYRIIFYPDNYIHTKLRYFTFKLYNILKIVFQDKKKSRVFVYDDLPVYYSKLKCILIKFEFSDIKLIEINNQKIWKKLKKTLDFK